MGMVSLLSNLAREILANRKGESALDQLSAALDGHLRCRSEQDVDVIRHYDKCVYLELLSVAVTKERSDEKFRDRIALKDPAPLMRDSSQHV